MPYDMDESQMLGELQDLEDDIEVLNLISTHYDSYLTKAKILKALKRILSRLEQDKERLEMRFRIHRQKVEERGVKF